MEQPPSLSGDATLELPEFDRPPADPIALLDAWITTATAEGVREPRAVALATANAAGEVSIRTVILKQVDSSGILLAFSRTSRKGRDLADNPHAALNLYWRERLQQVSISGVIRRASDTESDAEFHARPRSAQATSAASHQSEPLVDLEALRRRATSLERQPGALPRPVDWCAWWLVPHTIEFWHGSTDRLHRRLLYSRAPAGWQAQLLQP